MVRFRSRAALAAALCLAACEGSAEGDGSVRSSSSSPGDSIVIGVGADEFVLRANRDRLGMYPLNAGMCESLVRLTPGFGVEPWLATGWEWRSPDTVRFRLRQGVRFHDGRPFDAAAVAYSLHRASRTAEHAFLSDSSVRIVDDSTVDVTPARLNRRLVEQLVHPTFSMLAPGGDPATRPVCTGPFRFVEYERRDRLTVERAPDYWGTPARASRLTFRFFPDDHTRVLALRAGEVDAILDVPASSVSALERAPGIRVETAPIGGVVLMYVSVDGEAPYDGMTDPAVRRAVAHAIDRPGLARSLLEGRSAAASTVNPPAVLGEWADRVEGIPFDPARAAAILDSVGWRAGGDGRRRRDGRPLELTLIAQPGRLDPAVPQYVQAALAEVGIGVEVIASDPSAFLTRLNGGEFELDIEVPNQNDGNPAFLLALRWYPESNVTSAVYMAPRAPYDSLVAGALSAETTREARRWAAGAMHELVDVQAAAIPLVGWPRVHAVAARVRGFVPHPSGTSQGWATLYLER